MAAIDAFVEHICIFLWPFVSFPQFQYGKITTQKNGHFRNGVIFTTYSSLISASTVSKVKLNTRLKQLVDWFGPEFDGCIIFDECHKAKHLIPSGTQKPTKTGMTVLELQKQLQNARVVYASATGEFSLPFSALFGRFHPFSHQTKPLCPWISLVKCF